mgnify:CR=1 FL=1
MVFHDFECSQCGLEQIDVAFDNSSAVRATVPCECGGEASMLFGRTNMIHTSHSGMYGKYHVGFGEVVRDYHHKQQLLKKYNCIESADPVGGSRCHRAETQARRAASGLRHYARSRCCCRRKESGAKR